MASGSPTSDTEKYATSGDIPLPLSDLEKDFRDDSFKAKMLSSVKLFGDGEVCNDSTYIDMGAKKEHGSESLATRENSAAGNMCDQDNTKRRQLSAELDKMDNNKNKRVFSSKQNRTATIANKSASATNKDFEATYVSLNPDEMLSTCYRSLPPPLPYRPKTKCDSSVEQVVKTDSGSTESIPYTQASDKTISNQPQPISEIDSVRQKRVYTRSHEIAPSGPRRVLITGLTSAVTDDALRTYLKKGCGLKIVDIERGANSDAAVVVSKSNTHLDSIQEYCIGHSCHGTFLQADHVEVSDTVKLTGFKPATTKDTLDQYLKKTDGVVKTRMINAGKACLVQFTTNRDAELFLSKRKSKLDSQKLTVQMYHPFLERVYHGIPGFMLILADPDVITYLAKSVELRKGIDEQCDQFSGRAEWGEDSNSVFWLRVYCKVNKDDSCASSKVEEWTNGCNMVLQQVQSLYQSKIVPVPFEKWDEAEEDIKQQLIAKACQDVQITLHPETAYVHLVGEREKVNAVACKLKTIIDRVDGLLTLHNYEMTKLFPIRQCFNTLFEPAQFQNKKFKIKDGFVEIKGSREDVNADICLVEDIVESASKRQLTEDTDFASSALAIMKFDEIKEYVKTQLLPKNLHLGIDSDDKGTIILVSKSRSHLEQGILLMKKILNTTVVQYDQEIDHTLQTDAFIRTLPERYKNRVICHRSEGLKVELTSTDYLHAQIVAQLQNHIANISSVKYCLPLSPGRFTFLVTFGETQYTYIKQETDISFSTMKNETISIEGERQKARIAVRNIRKYTDCLSERRLVETWPGFLDFIETDKGANLLSEFQLRLRCVVKVYNTNQINTDPKSIPACQTVGECRVSDCRFLFEVDELFKRNDDVLVVPVTNTLDYTEGIAKDMLRAGGISVSNDFYRKSQNSTSEGDVVSSSPGKLLFKSIKHAVLPVYEGSIEQQRLLGSAVLRCLEESSNEGHTSIVFPPLGKGQFKFPIDIIAQTMVETIKRFLGQSSLTSLRRVTICDSTLFGAKYFQEVMSEGIGNYVRKADIAMNGEQLSKNLPVHTVQGQLVDQKMDVIVTFAPFGGKLDNVEIVGKLPKGTKHEITELFKSLYPNSVGYGEVATLSLKGTADINFNALFFCILPDEKVNPMLVLRITILRCLQKAEQNGYSSIGFQPARIRELCYQSSLVVETMFDAFGIYVSMRPNTEINVLIAIDKEDVKLLKVVDSAIMSFDANSTKSKSNAHALRSLQGIAQKDISYTTNINDVTLGVIEGDIAEQTTAVIVNSTHSRELKNGNVSNAILSSAGNVIQGECRGTDADRQFTEKGFVMTSPGKLMCQCIVHLKAAGDVETWKEYITNCLEEIEKQGLSSVSFPVLGTGARGMKLQTMVKMMYRALEFYVTSEKYKGVLKLAQIVCYDTATEQKVAEKISKYSNKSRRIQQEANGKDDGSLVSVHVYGNSAETVERAVHELTNIHIEYKILKVMPKTMESKMLQIHDVERMQGVAVVYDKSRRQVTIHGYDKISMDEAKASLDIILKT